jgi:serine acetyltransferase
MDIKNVRKLAAKIFVDLLHILSSCLVYGAVLYPHYVLLRSLWDQGYRKFVVIFSPAFFYTFLLGLTLVLTCLRLLLPQIKPGTFGRKEKKAFFIFALHHFLQIFMDIPFREILHRTGFLCYLFYRGMGMKLSTTTLISPTCGFRVPSLITLGENTVIGGMATIVGGFSLSPESMYFSEVKIGNNVLIGAGSTIAPGVEIGDDALVLAGSDVLPGTKISAGEAWGGRPAKKIGKKSLFIAIASQNQP